MPLRPGHTHVHQDQIHWLLSQQGKRAFGVIAGVQVPETRRLQECHQRQPLAGGIVHDQNRHVLERSGRRGSVHRGLGEWLSVSYAKTPSGLWLCRSA